MMGGFMKALYDDPEHGPRLRERDALEQEVMDAVECVMLDVAFSPVLLQPGDGTVDAVEIAYKAGGGKYVIKEPYRVLSTEETKIARARYLVTKGKEMEPFYKRFFDGQPGDPDDLDLMEGDAIDNEHGDR